MNGNYLSLISLTHALHAFSLVAFVINFCLFQLSFFSPYPIEIKGGQITNQLKLKGKN